jgi:hypothetical protein
MERFLSLQKRRLVPKNDRPGGAEHLGPPVNSILREFDPQYCATFNPVFKVTI